METLSSVLGQTFSNWECIMIDNDSQDNTREIAMEFVKRDSRFSYFHQQNLGVSNARNTAIQKSKGKYILPLDSDDKIGSGYLGDAVKMMESDPLIKVVYCDAELFGEASGKWNLPEYSSKTMLMENAIFCTALYRRADYDGTPGYNEAMKSGFEDWDFWLTLLGQNGKVYKIPKVYFYYRIRKSSRNNSLNENAQLELRKTIYSNHKSLYDSHLSLPEVIFEWYKQKETLRKMNASKEWRLGKVLLSTLRKIYSSIRKTKT
jgi:glycosyltransferase involved in cell wall biosynthesis